MGQRTCPHCGTTNAQDARTCSWCGRSLDDDATQPLAGPVSPPGGEQPSREAWQRGDSGPEQPSGGSWDQAPTQQQPSGGTWEPPSPAQPAAGSRDQAPTRQQPSEGSWEPAAAQQPPPPPGGGWQQPGGGSWGYGQEAASPGQQPAWGAQGAGGQAQWGTAGQAAAPRRGKPVLWIALAAVVVVALVAVALAVSNIGNTARKVARSNEPLQAPANIGGLARIDSGTIRSTLDQQSNQLRQKGAKNFVVAAYGTETQPQFVLVAVREANDKTRQDITTGFDEALGQQTGGAPAQNQTYEQGGVDYRCTSSQLGATVAICRFNDGDVVGFGFSGTQNPQRVSQFTAEARDKMK